MYPFPPLELQLDDAGVYLPRLTDVGKLTAKRPAKGYGEVLERPDELPLFVTIEVSGSDIVVWDFHGRQDVNCQMIDIEFYKEPWTSGTYDSVCPNQRGYAENHKSKRRTEDGHGGK